MGMNTPRSFRWFWLTGVVLAHLVISMIHGTAHVKARVPLTPAANAFVFAVILGGPIVGLALTWPSRRLGLWLVASTMAASLVFGLVNHFMLASPDHIAHVDPQWRPLFATTAVLLAITEGLGSYLAIQSLRMRRAS
jgi:hypothetical protein